MLLAFGGVIDLQRKYPDGVKHVRIVRTCRQQTTELDPRIFVALFAHQAPGIAQPHIQPVGIGRQPCFQKIKLRGPLGQQLRLEQGRQLPRRTQFQRPVYLAARAVGIAHTNRCLSAHQMGFGKIGIGLRQLIKQPLYRKLVGVAGEGPHHANQGIAHTRRLRSEIAGETASQLIYAPAGEQQGRQHLACLLGIGLKAQPQSGRFQRGIVLSRMKGDLCGAAHNSRVARAHRQIKIGTGRKRKLTSLRGYLGKQELIKNLPGQLLLRQPILCFRRHRCGLRGRLLRPGESARQR